jgi:hypothetical protein
MDMMTIKCLRNEARRKYKHSERLIEKASKHLDDGNGDEWEECIKDAFYEEGYADALMWIADWLEGL